MTEISSSNTNRLVDLPIKENFDDEKKPEYMTSIVWEPFEHLIHNPERSLNEYNWTHEELRKVNWSAIKVAWQRMLLRRYREENGSDSYTVFLGDNGWADHPTEVKRDYGKPAEPEIYDQ